MCVNLNMPDISARITRKGKNVNTNKKASIH